MAVKKVALTQRPLHKTRFGPGHHQHGIERIQVIRALAGQRAPDHGLQTQTAFRIPFQQRGQFQSHHAGTGGILRNTQNG